MNKLLAVLKLVALISFSVACIGLSTLAFHVTKSSDVTAKKLDLDLDEAHRVLLEAGLTASEARKASADERRYLGQWNKQISVVLANASSVLLSTQATINGVNASQAAISKQAVATLKSLQQSADGLQPVEANLGKSAADLDAFINSPDLIGTAHHLNGISDHMDGATGDFQRKEHEVFYPPKCEGKWCIVKRTWNVIEAGHDMPEMLYWLKQIHPF